MSPEIEIKEFSGLKLKEAAQIALSNRLYVPKKWLLSREFRDIKSSQSTRKNAKIAIAYLEGKPVGVSFRDRDGFVQAFVRKSQRRKGIGKSLVSRVKNEYAYAGEGIKSGQSQKFWKSVGIEMTY